MPAKITNNLRILNANQFLNLFSVYPYNEWASGVAYAEGQVVKYETNKYIALGSGTSGNSPPTHSTGTASDDNIDWLFIEKNFGLNFFKNKIYIGIGKTQEWRPFLVVSPPNWVSAAYSINDVVIDATDSNYYIAITDHSGEITVPSADSTNWALMSWVSEGSYIEGDIIEYSTNYYIALQTHDTRVDTPDIDTDYWLEINSETPLIPENDFENMYRYLDNLVTVKKLSGNDVEYGIVRHDWVSGDVYDAFDPAIDDFNYNNSFYTITDDFGTKRIYKCLDNAGGASSTIMPTSESSNTIRTADGYLWKYMGRAGNDALESFISSNYFPVVYKTFDDGSGQWLAQQNAKKNSISNIKVVNGGTGYDGSTTITISAPDIGTDQATASIVLDNDSINYIELSNIGSGYINPPTVTIGGNIGNEDAVLEVVMAPKDGNGSNILKELNARYVIIQTEFQSDEGSFPAGDNYFPITGENDFRQISIMIDPYDWNSEVCNNTYYIGYEHNDFVDPTLFTTFNSVSSYVVGDYVIYDNLHWVCSTNHSGVWNSSNFTQLKEQLETGSGTLLYIDNSDVVTRASGQTEDIKIILKF